jgi:DNA-binding LacI/PurR family transcriptional regulator
MEDDLVQLLEKIITLNLTVGEHVGIISYNETPLKKFIMKGLTTISTDFEAMGLPPPNWYLTLRKNISKILFT